MAPSWICLWMPELALDGVLRGRQVEGALVLIDGPVHGRRLVAVNAAAEQAGLRVGQSLNTAKALLANFEVVIHDAAEELQSLNFLAGVAYRFSSDVHFMPRAIVLEAGRSAGLFGDAVAMTARLRQELSGLGFRHQLAVAPTPLAACVLAGMRDGIVITDQDALYQALERVPLQRIAWPGRAVGRLPDMGIRTLGQLRRLPREGLRRRFGGELVDALEALLGERPDSLARYIPPDTVDWRIELSHEVEDAGALVFPLRRMTSDLAAHLRGRDGGVQRFCLQLEHQSGQTEVMVGLLAPTREADLLFEAARGRLERVQLSAPVLALRLMAADLPPFVPEGRDLFDARCAQAMPFDALRERLRARLGDASLQQWRTTGDPRPEFSQAVAASDTGWLESRPRPTWLLPAPRPWHGPPPRILAGPERLETGWWDGAAVRRDYYLVETVQGQRAWAFCPAGETAGWMLHGWFA